MPLTESITPESGTYLNECNFAEPEWQKQFYGENYEALKDVKNRWDKRDFLMLLRGWGVRSGRWMGRGGCVELGVRGMSGRVGGEG